MKSYDFFASMLRFVAGRIEGAEAGAAESRTAAMAASLHRIARAAESGGDFEVPGDGLEIAARALAGFAALLQKSILPEAVAHGNRTGEVQIRWSVDAAMEAVNTLLARAALQEGMPVRITLPPPPA